MAVLFAGNEPEAFSPASASVLWSTTASSVWSADYSRGALGINGSGAMVVELADQNEMWVQTRHLTGNSVGSDPVIQIRDSAGNPLFALKQPTSSGGIGAAYYTSATASTVISPTAPFPGSTFFDLCLHVKLVATNQALIECYVNGVLISSATITTTWLGTKKPATVRFSTSSTITFTNFFSELIITDTENPIGWRVATLVPNGNGTTGDWAGSYVDIDEIGQPDDNDFISSDTASQVELFALSNLSIPAQNMAVKAVCLSARARVGAGGPQNIQPGVRTGGADYYGGSFPGLTGSFSNKMNIWGVNPATSAIWSIADVQNLEAGFKSVT